MKVLGGLGTGTGSESPLVVLARKYLPEQVYAILSDSSAQRLSDLKEQIKDLGITVYPIFVNPEDPSDIYSKIRGLDVDVVDITSGTKVMAAVLFFYAVKKGKTITYVTGVRDPKTGRVITGTERVTFLEYSGLVEG